VRATRRAWDLSSPCRRTWVEDPEQRRVTPRRTAPYDRPGPGPDPARGLDLNVDTALRVQRYLGSWTP